MILYVFLKTDIFENLRKIKLKETYMKKVFTKFTLTGNNWKY